MLLPTIDVFANRHADGPQSSNAACGVAVRWGRFSITLAFCHFRLARPAPALAADVLSDFLAERTATAKAHATAGGTLYAAFSDFCLARGVPPWSIKGFSRAMVDRGFARTVISGRVGWDRLVLLPVEQERPA